MGFQDFAMTFQDLRETKPWTLIKFLDRLFKVGTYSKLGAYKNFSRL